MASAYTIVLGVLLVCDSITASRFDATHCSDVTGNVNYTIIDEVKAEVPGLIYDDSYFPLAQQYGITGKKPDPEEDYIYLDKDGKFPKDEPLPDAARAVIRSVTEKTRTALQNRPGIRPYSCVAVRCFETTNEITLRISCVARMKTELPSLREADAICSDVTEAINAAIVGVVQMEVPTLIYNESYLVTAQQYGISRKKPTPEDAYIYLDKNGTFEKGMSLPDAARQLMRGVTETTKNALRSRSGYRPYACVAIRCFEKDNTAQYILEISCVARLETEDLPAGTAYCSDVTGTVDDVIIAEVKAEVPGLMYSKDYVTLAQNYGIRKEKPQSEGDYIYLDKEGKFAKSVDLTDAARALLKSVTIGTREAEFVDLGAESQSANSQCASHWLKRSPGTRLYACLAVSCVEKDDTSGYMMRIACVARKATGSS